MRLERRIRALVRAYRPLENCAKGSPLRWREAPTQNLHLFRCLDLFLPLMLNLGYVRLRISLSLLGNCKLLRLQLLLKLELRLLLLIAVWCCLELDFGRLHSLLHSVAGLQLRLGLSNFSVCLTLLLQGFMRHDQFLAGESDLLLRFVGAPLGTLVHLERRVQTGRAYANGFPPILRA